MILHGDCLEQLKRMDADSVDSLVTDPPAGINFMNLEFDSDKGGRDHWIAWLSSVMKECLRVMKPGAHGFVWSIPRTSHWTATALEDAGFRIKDAVQHVFGSGFPKSHSCKNIGRPELGSALKTAVEIWWLIQKPLEKGLTIDKNVLKHGCGALNIDASRVATSDKLSIGSGKIALDKTGTGFDNYTNAGVQHSQGRFPANLVLSHNPDCVELGTKKVKSDAHYTHKRNGKVTYSGKLGDGDDFGNPLADKDGTETVAAWECAEGCPVAELDKQSLAGGMHGAGKARAAKRECNSKGMFSLPGGDGHRLGDSGGASRFFYCAKASKSEKNAGCEGLPIKQGGGMQGSANKSLKTGSGNERDCSAQNHHPTVKPLKLMSYLITLVTPPNGTVLDPFAGSGSTGVAAIQSGFNFIGIEREKEYVQIANKRIYHALPEFKKQLSLGEEK